MDVTHLVSGVEFRQSIGILARGWGQYENDSGVRSQE